MLTIHLSHSIEIVLIAAALLLCALYFMLRITRS
jgi:hypothetical protein